MACAKPIIATSVGGNKEIILNNITGILIPPNNPEEMAKNIIKLIKNSKLREYFGSQGRIRVKAEFDLLDITKKFESLYIKINKKG